MIALTACVVSRSADRNMKSLLVRSAPQFRPCFRMYSYRPIHELTSALSSEHHTARHADAADDVGSDAVSNNRSANTEPSTLSFVSTQEKERTYAQKIRDEFLEKERKRLPGILKKVEKALAEPEKEKYGEFRGLVIYRERNMPRGASIKSAKRQLSAMIGKRHALRHGFHRLTHMKKNNELGKSILGRDTDQILNVLHARIILNQFWCFGRSTVYEHLKRQEELRRESRQKQGLKETIGSGTLVGAWNSSTKIDIRHQIVEDYARELRGKIPELKLIEEWRESDFQDRLK